MRKRLRSTRRNTQSALCRARGVLVTRAGDNVIRLLPPLVVKRGDLESFLVAFDAVLASGVGLTMEGGGGAVA